MNGLFIYTIRVYQKLFSPLLSSAGIQCIYKKSCSDYCVDQLKKHNFIKALILCALRILSCNPVNSYLKNKKLRRTQ